jgi:hypothetical protein
MEEIQPIVNFHAIYLESLKSQGFLGPLGKICDSWTSTFIVPTPESWDNHSDISKHFSYVENVLNNEEG